MPPAPDLSGSRYGRLLVMKRVTNSPAGKTRWQCVCDCGEQVEVVGSNLRRGTTTSCGCAQREAVGSLSKTHGMSTHPLYKVWLGQRNRCRNPNSHKWSAYGGRGIRFAEVWDDFSVWLEYVLALPFYGDPKRSLDRIDNDGNYEPGNLRWATASEQASNRRKKSSSRSTSPGVTWSSSHQKWRVRTRKGRHHVGLYATEQEAIAVARTVGWASW